MNLCHALKRTPLLVGGQIRCISLPRNKMLTTRVRRNTTALPRLNPEALHRAAIEKAVSKNVAVGRKIIPKPADYKPIVPDFKKIPEVFIRSKENSIVGLLKLNPFFFDCKPRKDILYLHIVWQLACRRQGTHKTKYKHEVAYTKKKMYRQKGTGRARHGNKTAPTFMKGGHAHPKRPRDYSYHLNRKVRLLALRMALTTKYQQGKLIIIDDLTLDSHKTFLSKAYLLNMIPTPVAMNGGVHILDGEVDKNFETSSWNLNWVDYLNVDEISVYEMMRRNRLILTTSALKKLEERFKKEIESST
ncbi:ribosomal protein L4 [Acrasis kona]|uniref:Large ribosomal subunit protein uL4m n=1 Tax=Acrasis kona TaxID=1008807 RepID=A0AAW2ZGC3_9EUKA